MARPDPLAMTTYQVALSSSEPGSEVEKEPCMVVNFKMRGSRN